MEHRFMPKNRKIKFYTHNFLHIRLQTEKRKKENGFLIFFYVIGLFVLAALKKICIFSISVLLFPKKDFQNTRASIGKRLKNFKEKKFAKAFILFLILSFSVYGGLKFLKQAAKALRIKDQIIETSISGAQFLNMAKSSVKQKDFQEASSQFLKAYNSFQKGQKELELTSKALNDLTNSFPIKKDAKNMLEAAELVSKSGMQMTQILNLLGSAKLSAQGIDFTDNKPKEIYSLLSGGLDSVSANLDSAQAKLKKVNESYFPKSAKNKILEVKNQFGIFKSSFDNLREILKIFIKLTEGKKQILVFFENNNELRANGGFLGTYGKFDVENGKINKTAISSIYDLDGQLLEKIQPPTPILNVNDRWFLRDSNWFADFPASAKKMSQFYEKEGGESPDAIFVLTPKLITDFLKILGPVYLPKYNLTLDSENFVEQTQVFSSVLYANFTSQNKPKQILADLMPILLQKIGQANTDQTIQILLALQDNFKSKQILAFAKDPDLEEALQKYNWTGNMLKTDRDYLSVVSSNLGGTKTDLFIDQKIDLKSEILENGEILNNLEITRKNNLPEMENSENLSFLRIFVPKGAVLLENSGFDVKDLGYKNDTEYKIDPDVYEWEKNCVKDVTTGTLIGVESDKTFFGNWVLLKGGQEKVIKIKYKLPYKLNAIDHFSLLLQKQAGSLNHEFTYQLNFKPKKVEWQNFNPKILKDNFFEDKSVFDQDLFFAEVFTKR
jgi:hypothetical protein